jgi:CxxC motif-containing protein (DUF1111 family)
VRRLIIPIALAAGLWPVASPAHETIPDVSDLLVRDSGGAATARGDERRILATRLPGLTESQLQAARHGEAFFNSSFEPSPGTAPRRDGLGPLFNSLNCRSCHSGLGRGRPPTVANQQPVALVLQLGAPGPDGEWGDDPVYGPNFNPFAVPGVAPEGKVRITHRPIEGRFADGKRWTLMSPEYQLYDLNYGNHHPDLAISPRLAQPIIGMGLLEAVPESLIVERAATDSSDAGSFRGRPNWVTGPDGRRRLGRFGWKANQADLRDQTTAALLNEMGITTHDRPMQNCTAVQHDCLAAPHGGDPEMSDEDLTDLVFFQQALAVPPRRNLDDPEVLRGAALFREAGCDQCHVPSLRTGYVPGLPDLSHQTIYPFTDLLLHDMGPGLADGRPDGEASGSDWRTPPLWGLGRTEEILGQGFYLHDGRANSLEEAILWHGGAAAPSQARFISMSEVERQALLAFLRSL